MYKKFFTSVLSTALMFVVSSGYAHAESLIGMVNNGDVYVKSGSNTNPWSMQLTSGTSATHLQMYGDRVAYIDQSGNLWLKQGLNSYWYEQTGNVASYSLTETDLLVLKNDGTAWYKTGGPTDGWDSNIIATNATAVYLSPSQLLVINDGGNLISKLIAPLDGQYVGGPDGGWNLIAQNARAAAVTDSEFAYIDNSGNVRGKVGPSWGLWWQNGAVFFSGASQIETNGTMICEVTDGNSALQCKPFTFVDEATLVFGDPGTTITSYSIAPGRVVVNGNLANVGQGLYGIDFTGFGVDNVGAYGFISTGWRTESTTGTEITTNGQ